MPNPLQHMGAPGREVSKAAVDLMEAFIRQFPRLEAEIRAGCVVGIKTDSGQVLTLKIKPQGLVVPATEMPPKHPHGFHFQ